MTTAVKVIHTADLHLGMTFKSLGVKSKVHRRDCQDVFSNLISLCIKERVDGLLIAGDLFDDPHPNKSIVTFVIDEFERLKDNKIPVFIISGNHDPYEKNGVWFAYKFPSNVFIFDSKKLQSKNLGNITVYGLAYIDDTTEPLKNFKAEDDGNFKVGLIHGSTTNIKSDEAEYKYRPIEKSQIEKSNLDYIALGHFHDFLEVPGKVKCCYSGSPEGLSFKNRPGSCALLVKYLDGKITVESVETGLRKFLTVEADCTKYENDSKIRKTLEENKGENNILRLVLKGSPSLEFPVDVDLLMKEFESKYFFLKIVDEIHLPDNLSEDETIRGQFIKLLRVEIRKEKKDEKKKQLENALRLGVGYLDKRL